MSGSQPGERSAEVERLCELANVGAEWAAGAFSQLVGRPVLARAPSVHGFGRLECSGCWSTGLFFEAEGDLTGLVAIFLSPATRAKVTGLLLSRTSSDPPAGAAASALRELGNIAASQTVSVIANTLGARILISVPELVMEGAAEEFASRLPGRRGARSGWMIESELYDPAGDLHALLVFAPDLEKLDVSRRR